MPSVPPMALRYIAPAAADAEPQYSLKLKNAVTLGPNVTGTFNGGKTDTDAGIWQSGAISLSKKQPTYNGSSGNMALYSFNAAKANSLYGKSTTNQPASAQFFIIVKN